MKRKRIIRKLFVLALTLALFVMLVMHNKASTPILKRGYAKFGNEFTIDESIAMMREVGKLTSDNERFTLNSQNNSNALKVPGHENSIISTMPRENFAQNAIDDNPIDLLSQPENSSYSSSKSIVAICVCTTSKGSKSENMVLSKMATLKIMLPSLIRTLEYENENLQYMLFVGYDEDDVFWRETSIQEQVKLFADKRIRQINVNLKTNKSSRTNEYTSVLPIHFFGFPSKPNHIPFNEIIRMAKEHGADYFVRINDDTEFVTTKWASMGIQALANFNPPNVGVVGPTCYEGNTAIMTHDMVHKSHMAIFDDEYYPDVFDNWYLDDWISSVYGKSRTKKVQEWVVKHHIFHHGTRYVASEHHVEILKNELQKGYTKVKSWIVKLKHVSNENSLGNKQMSHISRRVKHSIPFSVIIGGVGKDVSVGQIRAIVPKMKKLGETFENYHVLVYESNSPPDSREAWRTSLRELGNQATFISEDSSMKLSLNL